MPTTSQPTETDGLALRCAADGAILERLRLGAELRGEAAEAQTLDRLVEAGSAAKARRFLERIQRDGAAFDWELIVELRDGARPMHFLGCRAGEGLMVLGADSPAQLDRFYEEMARLNNAQANDLRETLRRHRRPTAPQRDGASELEGMARLNNELADAQRELAKKNGALEQANEQLRHTQKLLEQREAELVEANRELEAQATHDALTGLANRLAFGRAARREMERAGRAGSPLSLLMIDVDHFKQFNDTFGHVKGDEVLADVAGILERTSREPDLVARYGGEEFAVLLPQADDDGAAEAAERCRAAVEAHHWADRPITISLGVAGLSRGVDDPAELVGAADEALYRAKATGRNLVRIAGRAEP